MLTTSIVWSSHESAELSLNYVIPAFRLVKLKNTVVRDKSAQININILFAVCVQVNP
jgi:hypothetical protein